MSIDVQHLLWLLVVAVCEELFFRGLLLDGASKWLGFAKCKAAFSVSVIFALAHLLNLRHELVLYVGLQVCFALGMSMFLAYVYWRYHIVVCMLIHGVVNLIAAFITTINTLVLVCYLVIAMVSFIYGAYAVKKLEVEK